MTTEHIGRSIGRAIEHLTEKPDRARYTDSVATAVVDGLKSSVEGPDGITLVTDMPRGVGGEASAPTPGWFLRAALASCDATVIAMRAAQEGVELSTLEVTVDSVSDDQGLFGMDDSIPAGPLSTNIRVKIGADGVADRELRDIVEWADQHSPVSDALQRAVPTSMDVEVV